MSKSYTVHVGSMSGPTASLVVPDYLEGMSSVQTNIPVSTAEGYYQFDKNYSYLCSTESDYNEMLESGLFPNIIPAYSYTSDSPLYYYFYDDAYIAIYQSGDYPHLIYHPSGSASGYDTLMGLGATFLGVSTSDGTESGKLSVGRAWNVHGSETLEYRLTIFFGFEAGSPSVVGSASWAWYQILAGVSDPYNPGGDSGIGGGGGGFSDDSDDIDFPDLPTLSAVSTGFVNLFSPTSAQMAELADYMWNNDLFSLDTYKKIFADPMDCLIGLSIVPCIPSIAGSSEVTVGNIGTGIAMEKLSSQYVDVDCGSILVEPYWNCYLDYSPYTEVEIFLPYCGTHPLKADDVMGKTVHVDYHVDVLSGACTAYVKCGNSVLYSFVGECAASIPISGSQMTNVINGILSIAGSVGSMVASGGITAPAAIGTVISGAATAASSKPEVERSGSLSGTGGMLSRQIPYLIITRPNQCHPTDQNTFTGYPSMITENLSDLSGFTSIHEIHMEGMTATDSELTEIEALLTEGVIF